MLYGKSAAVAAVASSDDSETPSIREHQRESDFVPELTKEFFDSPFFRRFQVQSEPFSPKLPFKNSADIPTGPVLDPSDFVQRYLSASPPNAAAMGPEGALLCHVLVAWAASYGVDERGRLDVPDGGGPSLAGVSLSGVSDAERQREADRQRRWSKMRSVVEVVLREIDDSGVLRRPTWDGVRALLLILPLTEGESNRMVSAAVADCQASPPPLSDWLCINQRSLRFTCFALLQPWAMTDSRPEPPVSMADRTTSKDGTFFWSVCESTGVSRIILISGHRSRHPPC